MLDFIGSTFISATLACVIALSLQAVGFESAGVWIGVTALMLSVVAFASLIVAGLVWTIRHVRLTII